jgi:hypothetical protein
VDGLKVGLVLWIMALIAFLLFVAVRGVGADSIPPPAIVTCPVRQIPMCLNGPGVVPGVWSPNKTTIRIVVITGGERLWINRCCLSSSAPRRPSPPGNFRLLMALLP